MRSRTFWRHLGAFLICFLFCGAAPLHAERIAILPLADLSRGDNGLNLPLTKDLAAALEGMGATLVPETDVLSFLAANRLREAGYLDVFTVRKMGRELHCSLILVGTVTEWGGADPALGLTLTAFDAEAGRAVWSRTGATSRGEQVRALAIGQPQEVDDLKGLLFDEMLGELRNKVSSRIMPLNRLYQLAGVQVSPAYAKGGDEVEGLVKIRFLDARPARIAIETEGGPAYLYRDANADSYRGRWRAPLTEGAYPVSLALEWGRNRSVERIRDVAGYEVINEPPQLSLEIKKGVSAGEVIAFRDHLLILPRLVRSKPMTRWQLEIKNEDGEVLVREEHEGNLPERMVWEGRDGSRRKLANGTYEIVLHAWDLAGNHSVDARMVALQSSALPVTVGTLNENGKTFLKIETAGEKGFPLTSWSLNATSLQGDSLLTVEGTELPVMIELPPLEGQETIEYNFEGEDFLGNRLRMDKKKVELGGGEKLPATEVPAKSWVSDF
jgi:hypothetical protein